MSEKSRFEKCLTYIDCQLQGLRTPAPTTTREERPPTVTISREAGAGGITVAEKLAEVLQKRLPHPTCPWTVFHRNLVEKVLADHRLPSSLARFMPEDKISGVADALEEFFGLHPPSEKLVRQMAETVLRLAELGNVILVGRGANVITRHLEHTFHVRLVGSLERRVAWIREYEGLSEKAARAFVRKEDAGRRSFVKRYFGMGVEDPLLYHLTINTDLVTFDQAAALIGHAVVERFGPR
jgi:cytidylate kinase